jgi:hypothetical protein
MSADLNLTYRPVANSNPNTVLDLGGEYCFGQDWGCQNATTIDGEGFAVPFMMSAAGHLLELYGNISDSTFDGTNNFGPLPTGEAWGAANDFYLLPGGCGIFEQNLNSQGFPNPAPLLTLHSWLPHDALHLTSLPLVDRIASGETGKATLQGQVESIFSVPVQVNAGDCMLVIYGRSGNGTTNPRYMLCWHRKELFGSLESAARLTWAARQPRACHFARRREVLNICTHKFVRKYRKWRVSSW